MSFVAQAVDVHRVAVGEPADPLLELLGAGRRRVRAVEVDLAGLARDRARRSSGRSVGKTKGTLGAVAGLDLDADDLGDDLAGLLDHDRVADPDVLAGDLVGVVQAGPLDGRAGQRDRASGRRPASACRSCRPGRVMPTIFVTACSASYLNAITQRGLLLRVPSRSRWPRSSTLMTRPSVWKSSVFRRSAQRLGVLDHLVDRVVDASCAG